MICACGFEFGRVTVHTNGSCPVCTRSIWMQVARRYQPKSEAIAAGLNRRRAPVCVHHNAPCFSRCGVEMGNAGWQAITPEAREAWFARVEELGLRDEARRANRRRSSSPPEA